jgi:hypothetical protein
MPILIHKKQAKSKNAVAQRTIKRLLERQPSDVIVALWLYDDKACNALLDSPHCELTSALLSTSCSAAAGKGSRC